MNLTPLYTFVSKNVVSVSEVSTVNLIFYFVSACVPHRYYVIDKSFLNDLFCVALTEYFLFYLGHKNVSGGYVHFHIHGCSMSFKRRLGANSFLHLL